MRGYFPGEREGSNPHEEVVWVQDITHPDYPNQAESRLATIVTEIGSGKVLGLVLHEGGGKHLPYEVQNSEVKIEGNIIYTKGAKLRIVKRDVPEDTKRMVQQ